MPSTNSDQRPASASPAIGRGARPARRQADDPAAGRATIDALECEANAMMPTVDTARTDRRRRRDDGARR
jgi:hypothetical protein